MPVRKTRQIPGSNNVAGWLASDLMKHGVPFESILEMSLFAILEILKIVTSYHPQPFKSKYKFANRTRVYTPDVEIHLAVDVLPVVVEVKPFAKIDWLKFRAVKHHIETVEKKNFVFATDQHLYHGCLLENVQLFSYFARYKVKEEVSTHYAEILQDRSLPIIELASAIFPHKPNLALNSIMTLIYQRKLACDFHLKLIDDETLISLATEAGIRKQDLKILNQILKRF